jgi:hypothetical protein
VDAVRVGEDGPEFIQIKIYKNPSDVIEQINKTNEMISTGKVDWTFSDGTKEAITKPPTFAVNEEIYEEVVKKVNTLGLPNKIENMGLSREDIKGILNDEIIEIKSEFFESLLTPVLMATAIQGLFNWYRYRDINKVINSLPENLAISTAGVAGGLAGRTVAAEAVLLAELEFLSFVASPIAGIAMAYVARGMTKRISKRVDITNNFVNGNIELQEKLKAG